MRKLTLLLLFIALVYGCNSNDHQTEFKKNTDMAKSYFKLHEVEDAEAMFEYLHPDMEWHMPGYGMPLGGIDEVKAALLGYQDNFEDLSFTAEYWLPGVNSDTGIPDGSTRVYGNWKATQTASGKKVDLTSYHSFEFKDGKIFKGGDWFDLGGMMNSLIPEAPVEKDTDSE